MNVEMNYWPAEVCNLSELTHPLFALVTRCRRRGPKTAHAYYQARGWVAHVITNPWGFTSPGEAASWGASTAVRPGYANIFMTITCSRAIGNFLSGPIPYCEAPRGFMPTSDCGADSTNGS